MKALSVLKDAGPELELGARYKDTVSLWEGVLTACYVYLNGCVRVELSGKDDKGEPKGFVFDHEQVELVKAEPVVTKPSRPTGGPRDNSVVAR